MGKKKKRISTPPEGASDHEGEAASEILAALREEGITDSSGVKDLIFDYHALADQYQKLYQKYEEPAAMERLGEWSFCPVCHKKNYSENSFCWNCGKRLKFIFK